MMSRFAKCSYKQCANVLCYENADCLGMLETGRIQKNVIGIVPGCGEEDLLTNFRACVGDGTEYHG